MRLGMGLAHMNYWASDDKIVNLMHPMAACHADRGRSPGITWDNQGWPTLIPPGTKQPYWIPACDGYVRPGRYRLEVRGSGKIWYGHPDLKAQGKPDNFVVKSPAKDVYTTLAEWDMRAAPQSLFYIQATDPADHIRDVRLYRIDQDPETLFTSEYVNELKAFDTLRTCGYTGIIASGETEWPAWAGDVLGNPVKYAAAIAICCATRNHLWLNIPHRATDHFVAELARLVQSMLRPELKVYLEWSIEVWNTGWPFAVEYDWCRKFGLAQTPPLDYQQAYALRAHQVQEVFHAAAPKVNLVRVFADQFGWPDLATKALKFADQRGLKFDVLATAPYCDSALSWAVLDPLCATGKEEDRQEALDLVFAGANKTLGKMEANVTANRKLADAHKMTMACYEMGPAWTIPGNSPKYRKAFYLDTHRDHRMKDFLSGKYFPWLAQYYDLGMYTQHTSPHGDTEFWGVRGNATEMPCPKLDACLEWAATHNHK